MDTQESTEIAAAALLRKAYTKIGDTVAESNEEGQLL
jgi:hypothetical protein